MSAAQAFVRHLGVRPFGWGDPPEPAAMRAYLLVLWGTSPADMDRRLRN